MESGQLMVALTNALSFHLSLIRGVIRYMINFFGFCYKDGLTVGGRVLFQFGKLHFKLANPFAPLPLQELHHYCGFVRPSTLHCYSASSLYLLCLPHNINVTGSRVP